ncbi:MAG: glycosyltransferase [Oscillatoriales cyanobacterium C42_A2020_001]|nr:glycosyltransferase [Leptolyngbyaceae cyanobacterium C42_A2020_001]
MTIISRVRLQHSEETAALYIQPSEDSICQYDPTERTLTLNRGESLSSNTYFNSLYEVFYARYTNLLSVYYWLHLEGDFAISIYRETEENSDRKAIYRQVHADCQLSNPVQIKIPGFAQDPQPGRIYFELECLSDRGVFKEGLIVTDQPANQSVRLGIISCTYKKENYIQNTVNTILEDPLLRDKSLKIFVVDNGRTLKETTFVDARVQLIPNRNVGGSGGFTRGLVEALQDESYTHFLFMDDDVALDSEVIYKLFSLYEYAKSEVAIAGGMLDLHKKYLLFEAGAHYAKSQFRDGFEPFEIAPLKTDLDLRESTSLNSLLVEEPVDYGAFWFFAFPRAFVEASGLPLPFFIKGDDIEFGLRISRQLKEKIVAFPAIAVWHEPFYAKFPVWDSYYYFRNVLITHAIHGSLSYIKAVKDITVRLIYTLLFFDYNSAGMLIKAFEDYIQGPEFIKNHDPETYHSDIVKLSRVHQNQSVDSSFIPQEKPEISEAGVFRKLMSLLTLNGHLLPDFLISKQPTFIWYGPGYPGQRSRALARKEVLIFKEKAACLYRYEMNRKTGLKILFDWFKLVLTSRPRWSAINHSWKQSAQELVSVPFWQKYLQIPSQS